MLKIQFSIKCLLSTGKVLGFSLSITNSKTNSFYAWTCWINRKKNRKGLRDRGHTFSLNSDGQGPRPVSCLDEPCAFKYKVLRSLQFVCGPESSYSLVNSLCLGSLEFWARTLSPGGTERLWGKDPEDPEPALAGR